MKMSLKGKMLLTELEGIGLTKYKDSVGVWTIGIGATRTEIPDLATWPRDKALTVQQCFDLLDESLDKYEKPLDKVLTKEIPQNWYDALVSWLYNVGTGWIHKGTVIQKINAGASAHTVANTLRQYMTPPEIAGRREKEATLLETGKYTMTGKAEVIGHNKSINISDYIS